MRAVLLSTFLAVLVALSAITLAAPAAISAATPNAAAFSQNLHLWDTGSSVRTLQQFLNAHGFIVAQSAAGSPGYETTMFGSRTYKALVRFQAAHGLPATGFFGPLTRAVANSTLSSSASPTVVPTTAPTAIVPTPLTPPIYTTPPPTRL
jgi:peptidoglycan hydrolase-like protein with peptidoglycan-binding domain